MNQNQRTMMPSYEDTMGSRAAHRHRVIIYAG